MLIFLLFLTSTQRVYAREDLIPGSRYTSARAAAMGDAFLPLADDVTSSLFYNPANLSKIRKPEVELFNVSSYVNSPFVGMANSTFYQALNLNNYASTLESHPGQLSGLGGQFAASFGLPGFGFSILGVSQMAAQANSDTTITYKSVYQIIPAMGYGFKLLQGAFRFGYSVQYVNEAVGTQTVVNSGSIGYNQNLQQGSAFSHTVGLALTAPIRALPSLNFVVRNLMNTNYGSSVFIPLANGTSGIPTMEAMSADASFSIQPRLGNGTVMNLVIEDRDVTNRSGDLFIGHFALGAEISLRNTIFLRGGWGGGYPSAGLGMKRPGAEMSLTWYTEEIGTQYLSQGDTRFLFQYQVRNF